MSEENNSLEEAKKSPQSRAHAAAALWIRGASLEEIAQMLGYSSATAARNAAESAIAGSLTPPQREAAVTIAYQRYERLIKSVMSRAVNPKDTQQLAYNARANALIEGQIKLLGLQAPTRVEITPDQERLDEYTRKLQETLGLDPLVVEEADIFDEEEDDG